MSSAKTGASGNTSNKKNRSGKTVSNNKDIEIVIVDDMQFSRAHADKYKSWNDRVGTATCPPYPAGLIYAHIFAIHCFCYPLPEAGEGEQSEGAEGEGNNGKYFIVTILGKRQ